MPDQNDNVLVTFKGWTLRVQESSAASPRVMLLVHGLTGDENSMWVFAQHLPFEYWMIAPRAPHASQMEQGGFSWSPSGAEAEDRTDVQKLNASADALMRLVDEYSASVGVDAKTFDVLGFSQGAAMSSLLALLYPERVRRVGILAGFVPGGLEELISRRPLVGKPFFVAHGTKDETVTIERARASIESLEQAGAQVTYCEDEVGHKVSLTCLRALKDFLRDQ